MKSDQRYHSKVYRTRFTLDIRGELQRSTYLQEVKTLKRLKRRPLKTFCSTKYQMGGLRRIKTTSIPA